MPSEEHEGVRQMIAAGGGLGGPDRSLEEARAILDGLADLMPLDPDVSVVEVDVDGVSGEWLSVPGCNEQRAVLYLHGGAYTQGSLRSHRSLSARLARASGSRVLAVDYRLAPEHPHPAALDDSARSYRWLVAQGLDPAGIVIAGDSAGGGLAAATLLALRDAGDPLPAGAVLMSPWVDLTLSGASMTGKADVDVVCSEELLDRSAAWYANGADRGAPLVSPLFGDLGGLPPMLVLVGTDEVLLDDATRLASKASDAGVDVEIDVEDELLHVYPMFPGVPEADRALARMGDWIADR